MARLENLRTQLARLRSGYVQRRGGVLGLAALLAFVALLLVFVAADLLLHLPPVWCWCGFLAAVAIVGGGGFLVGKAIRHRMSDAAMAVLIEKVLPGVRNHLVNAVQLSAKGGRGAGVLVEEILAEADARLADVQPRQLAPRRWERWVGIGLGVAAVAFVGLLAWSPAGVTRSALRLLAPMARLEPYTLTRLVTVAPGNATLLRGATLDVAVRFGGILPKDARVEWDRGKERTEVVTLLAAAETGEADAARGQFGGQLKGVYYDSRYRVLGGDSRSVWYSVTVTNPPGLDEWEAKVTPLEYMGRPAFSLNRSAKSMDVPEGAEVVLGGAANSPLKQVRVVQDEQELAAKDVDGKRKFVARFRMRNGGPVRLALTGEGGLESQEALPFVVLVDQPPTVVAVDVKQKILAARDAQVPLAFRADDDYGVRVVGLECLQGEGKNDEVTRATPEAAGKSFQGRFLVDLSTFSVPDGGSLRLRFWAEDNGPGEANDGKRRGYSGVFEIAIPAADEQKEARKQLAEKSRDSLTEVIKMQRDNLKDTRRLADMALAGTPVAATQVQDLQAVQKSVRDLSADLLKAREALGDLSNVVAGLVNHEMADAIQALDEAQRVLPKEMPGKLRDAVVLETRILAALTGIPTSLGQEERHQEKVDLCERLQKLVAAQSQNLKDSKAAEKDKAGDDRVKPLAAAEDRLANDMIGFTDHCTIMLEQRVDDDFATQIRQVYDLVTKERVYEKMLAGAEALEGKDLAAGIQNQEEALRVLLNALDILNKWRVDNAKKVTKDVAEVLKAVAEKLGELEEKQAKIAEVTRDLASRGKLDDETRKQLAAMDKQQVQMADEIEKLAQDLYQFPDLPVCNELNSKMREIFEDVEQAKDSADAPAIEIAVQKEDALLDAIRNTKERVEDVEMWMMDIPDNIVWNMESFDTDEFPNMPLVPLPDELEDIVGDLLDQAQSIAEQSQDTTGNNMMADAEMGWGIMDGPMPNFSAKGKSGNARPNDNEMTGRSGAGREGQSNGELVEGHVKGLEGTKTHARRTRDAFQKGQVTEDENSTLDAKATGGGKLGGQSETVGMFGKAPRRDANLDEHGTSPTKLRQETEALYATARLLYLGTGSLGTAARELSGIEKSTTSMKAFESLHRKVLRRLEDTQVELSSGVVLPMPVAGVSKAGGAATQDVDVSKIAEEYRDIVTDYYRSLGNGGNAQP